MSDEMVKRAELAFQRGDLAQVESLCSQILTASPKSAPATVLMGLSAVRKGEYKPAVEWLEKAILLSPNDYVVHLWLPKALRGLGEPYEAIRFGERSRTLWPNDPEILSSLSVDYFNIYDYEKSAGCLLQAVKSEPRNPVLHRKLGSVYEAMGRDNEALREFQLTIDFGPGHEEGYIKLGRLLCGHGNYSQVIDMCQAALKILPQSSQIRLVYAHALKLVGESEKAEVELRTAIALDPEVVLAAALWLNEDGRFEEAGELFRQSIERRPIQGLAYQGLFMGRKANEGDRALVDAMESYLDHPSLTLKERAALFYALGKVANDLHDYERAMQRFDAGNDLKHKIFLAGKGFHLDDLVLQRKQTANLFTSEFLKKNRPHSSNSNLPIFIVGMIRSGTTLVEQIIASHPQVGGVGEQRFWISEMSRIIDLNNQTFDVGKFIDARERYLQVLRGLQPDAPRVTDKMPMNFMCAGLLHLAYPNAPIVHIKRNAVDNALSIYMTDLAKPPEFAHNKKNIVEAYWEYERTMEFWSSLIPNSKLLEVNYEDLISDQEFWTRRIIDFCGLDWDPACLDFYKSERQVSTPSMWQVRQPIYKTSVEKWRNYEPWLGEFSDLAKPRPELQT